MKIIADLNKNLLSFDGKQFAISCNIRSLANRLRFTDEVVLSIPGKKPYDPKPFPKGFWRITAVEWQSEIGFSEETYGPVKIRTNACQPVKTWRIDEDGDYLHETDETILDSGYLLHYSTSKTTLGCIRLNSPEETVVIAKMVESVLFTGEEILLEVIYV